MKINSLCTIFKINFINRNRLVLSLFLFSITTPSFSNKRSKFKVLPCLRAIEYFRTNFKKQEDDERKEDFRNQKRFSKFALYKACTRVLLKFVEIPLTFGIKKSLNLLLIRD
ncbi:hypothetical protein DRF60_10785 [Chryseobacterium elymi]|uniref:Uncharacterized protein n=1 Tax=Chryseobacterium elymi TaxID=395936 RepID=A0A3D9DJP6_9FLAO|nr:hypothetical protein DRF60_10785 [Chryseobacterium elymi]